jgi:hypothetical protein
MKRISLVAALLGAIVLAFAGIASANTGGAGSGTNWGGGLSGNGTQVTHYTAAYTDYFFGPVSCTGVHQVKKGATQDSFTCTSQNGPFTSVQPNQSLSLSTFGGWQSDAPVFGQPLATGFSGTVSADGTSYTAVATY